MLDRKEAAASAFLKSVDYLLGECAFTKDYFLHLWKKE